MINIKYVLKIFANTHVKINLIKATLESYNKALIKPDELIVYDDNSGSEKLNIIKELLHSYIPDNHKLISSTENKGHGWSSIYICEKVLNDNPECDYILLLNDDTLFHSQWLIVQNNLLEVLSQRKNFGAFSVFNNLKEHPSNHYYEMVKDISICQKDSSGGFGLIVSRDMIEYISKVNRDNYRSWDWAISDYLLSNNKVIYKTENSYLQHMGKLNIDTSYTENFIWEH